MCVKREAISILNDSLLKLVDNFTYLGSSVSSTENEVNIRLAKVWAGINWLSYLQTPSLGQDMTQGKIF